MLGVGVDFKTHGFLLVTLFDDGVGQLLDQVDHEEPAEHQDLRHRKACSIKNGAVINIQPQPCSRPR